MYRTSLQCLRATKMILEYFLKDEKAIGELERDFGRFIAMLEAKKTPKRLWPTFAEFAEMRRAKMNEGTQHE